MSGQGAANDITFGNTTPEVRRAVLRHLHTDELRFADEQLMDVMGKAKEISLDRFYKHCMQQVIRSMTVTSTECGKSSLACRCTTQSLGLCNAGVARLNLYPKPKQPSTSFKNTVRLLKRAKFSQRAMINQHTVCFYSRL